MTAGAFLSVALTGIALLLLLLGLAISFRRSTRSLRMKRRAAREAVVRPMLLRSLSEDEPDLSGLQLDAKASKVMESLVWSMLTKVRGASRAALVDWLVARGAVERARARTHRRGAVGRAMAAERLGAAAVASTSPDVVRLLHDRHSEVRLVAARALGKLGDPAAVPELLSALDGVHAVPAGLVSMSLLHVGPSAIDSLTDGLTNSSDTVRLVCADLLGMHGAFGASVCLAQLVVDDPSEAVRLAAASALGRIGSPQSVPVLSRVLAPSFPQAIRVVAAGSLGQIGGRNAIESLHTAINDPDDVVGRASAEALVRLGPQGRQVLELVSGEESALGRVRADDWLARMIIATDGRRSRRRDGVAVPGASSSPIDPEPRS